MVSAAVASIFSVAPFCTSDVVSSNLSGTRRRGLREPHRVRQLSMALGGRPHYMKRMVFRMGAARMLRHTQAFLAGAALAATICQAAPSYAQVVIPTNRNALVQQDQLQQLQNQLQRQQYQQQQQLYRELDRQTAPKPQPDVPVYDQRCRMEAIGNTISRVCR